MNVTFWGTRGSLPASIKADSIRDRVASALREFQKNPPKVGEDLDVWMDRVLSFSLRGSYGCSTPCVQVQAPGSNDFFFCDAGSGLRDFSAKYMSSARSQEPARFHLFLSHLHWDHIHGFPYFGPAYLPHNEIIIYGLHDKIPEIFARQMSEPCFPVAFSDLAATIYFEQLKLGEPVNLGPFSVNTALQYHPGDSYAYSFESAGYKFVYATDCEHKADVDLDSYPGIEFYQGADLLAMDGQYTLAESTVFKEDWGHSSNIIALELAARASVRQLALFHTEPTRSDRELDAYQRDSDAYAQILREGRSSPYPEKVMVAWDGLKIDLSNSG